MERAGLGAGRYGARESHEIGTTLLPRDCVLQTEC